MNGTPTSRAAVADFVSLLDAFVCLSVIAFVCRCSRSSVCNRFRRRVRFAIAFVSRLLCFCRSFPCVVVVLLLSLLHCCRDNPFVVAFVLSLLSFLSLLPMSWLSRCSDFPSVAALLLSLLSFSCLPCCCCSPVVVALICCSFRSGFCSISCRGCLVVFIRRHVQ